MKNLLIFVLLVSGGLVWHHDKDQTDQVARLQAQADQLNAQLADKQAALAAAQERLQKMAASNMVSQSPLSAPASPAAAPYHTNSSNDLQMSHLQESPLDQPARR